MNTMSPKNRLIFALDVPGKKEAKHYAKVLEGVVGCFKIGLELFISEGPDIVKMIQDQSAANIFLDLKLHDIPATVRGALRSAKKLGVRYITIHSTEGEEILETAQEVKGSGLEVLAVTVLTSTSASSLASLGIREDINAAALVLDRATRAQNSGCAGVVCSGEEAKLVKSKCGGDFKIVVPGIRPEWARVSGDDQNRIATPSQAIEDGADMIVVGRPIRDANDPREAAQKIIEEISV
ncbi:MAG: orotidine-5'-phosphate decarboxylase [Nitrospinaceae bacterium]|nr:orotidine-5'-phosphate decarboxylase [Nitrospinaceae bacterium]